MALNKKSVELPLIGGLDTKTDDKQIKVGKLLSAQNVIYKKPGKIEKRDGFGNLGKEIIDNATQITNGQALMTYKDELLAFDKENNYSYIESTNNWKDKGNFQSLYLENKPVTNGTEKDFWQDCAYHPNGLECYVWVRQPATNSAIAQVFYQVQDTQTKQIIVGPIAVPNNTCINPRVVTWEDSFVIFFYDTSQGQIFRGFLPINNLTTTPTWTSITNAGAGINAINLVAPNYNVAVHTLALQAGGSAKLLYMAFNNQLGTISLRGWDNPYTPVAQYNTAFTGVATDIDIIKDNFLFVGAEAIVVVFTSTPFSAWTENSIQLRTYNHTLTTAGKTGNLNVAANGNPCRRITAISKSTTAIQNYLVFVDYVDVTTLPFSRYHVVLADVSGVGVNMSLANSVDRQQIALASRAYAYNNKIYVIVQGGADIQQPDGNEVLSSYFIVDQSFNVLGRAFYNLAAGPNEFNYIGSSYAAWCPKINFITATEYFTSLPLLTATISVNGFTQTGLIRLSADHFNREHSYTNAQIAESLFVGGGMLFQYDGQNLVEDGFNWNPNINSMQTISGGGSGNTYIYRAVWEWVDNIGNIHRSGLSKEYVVQTATATPIGAGASVGLIQLMPLSLTYKTSANTRSPVQCVLYRTTANNPGPFYRLPVTTNNNNDISATYITPLNDTTTDAVLVGYPELYVPGSQQNTNPPPVGAMAVYRNRLFVVDSTNPLNIQFSQPVNFATTVDFGLTFTISVDPSGGDITGLATMDDKLIIFKENSIRFISGQGPNADGSNSDYGTTTLITTDAGCTNLRSIVSTPEGILFKSKKGIYFLNRGLQVSYIGAPVEAYNNSFITSGVLMVDNNQVRLTLDTNAIIVYDYFVDNWSVFTPLNGVDSVIWNDRHTFINSTGDVAVEQLGTYTDNGNSYPMEITTGWLAFGGVQGFQRLWKVHLLGNFMSNHQLQVDFYYDYNDAYYQRINVEPVIPNTYGSSSPYGNQSPYGGTFDLYQYELRPERQKCQAIKMRIQDIPPIGSSTLEAGYQLSNIRLSYGVIGGANRIGARQTWG